MAFLKNLLGGKKDNFQVQFDETPKTEAPPVATPAPATEAPAPAAEVPAPAPKKTKTSIKAKQKAVKQEAPPAPTPAPKPVARVKPAQPVVEGGFATKYMNTGTSISRRRPGANMKNFLDMARTAKK
ncbi:MAG: hypothetical protein J7545_06450 [Roseofilum sp. SBFL]|uniref:hypothetical protein n=1 Tax=unclassified Roseofilum TaxID=2620099 RepID=UPI001B135321|nr:MULTISPECIES: hypothetical protein [unclassified Roseofilum]MBP0012856.1 hypothetical protein [Roseofilum sp. SID3]MBP0025516.1 hypothetical protein [Roseofilum sp. SID2]MBP0037951.1 hypothetical protein [Roseofilum sp. SID1]MBP0041599.1 hypothetical protein [Roseofilum sp. SBFL]